MTPDQWSKLDDLFDAAQSLPPGEREAFARDRCADQPVLRDELLSLLRADRSDAALLAEPIGNVAPLVDGAHESLADDPLIGRRLGAYTITAAIGRGGMGVVYEARQDSPQRTVALKVVRPGALGASAVRRFEHESEVLGRLQHPGIAQVYESGWARTPLGRQPFFALELVRGLPLLEYIQSRALSVRGRLGLFATVCDAVQHAHTKGVIHRDLKPANILVDESGQPKILDFGIARLTDSDIRVTTLQTDIGQLIGTLPYMSPEQAAGDSRQLDTRSDVYALGVLLFELLSGRLPYDLREKPVSEAVRVISEQDATRLSSISRVFRGDIETITAKALEKDRARRYASAAELAADIRRYLADQAILARPASATYQLRKFARRHQALVGGVVAAFVLLVAGVVGTSIGLYRARQAGTLALREADKAREEAARAERINAYLASMLGWFTPGTTKGPSVTLEEVLDEAARRVEAELAGQPRIAAPLHEAIGKGYVGLGLGPQAVAQFDAARRRFESEGDEPGVARATAQLGASQKLSGDFKAAEATLRQAVPLLSRLPGDQRAPIIEVRKNLAATLKDLGKNAEAGPILEDAVAYFRGASGGTASLAESLAELGLVRRALRDLPGAEAALRESYELLRALHPGDDPSVATLANNLANTLKDRARFDEAADLYEGSVAMRTRLYGEESPVTSVAMNNLGVLYFQMGQYPRALELLTRVLALRRRVGGAPTNLANSLEAVSETYAAMGRPAMALPLMREAVQIRHEVLGEQHAMTILTRLTGAKLEAMATGSPDAVRDMEDLLARARAVRPRNDRVIVRSAIVLAEALCDAGRHEQAEEVCRDLLADCRPESDSIAVAGAYRVLGRVLDGRDQPAPAEASFRFADAVATLFTQPRARAGVRAAVLADLGAFLARHRRPDAESVLREALDQAALDTVPTGPARFRAAAALSALLAGERRFVEAECLLLDARADLLEGASSLAARRLHHATTRLYERWGCADRHAAFLIANP